MTLRVTESAEDPSTQYLEIFGVRVIIRGGLFIGWYDPELDEPLE